MTGAVATEATGLTPDSPAGPAVPALSAWSVLVAGVIGLVASVTLTLEKIDILLDPAYVPSCNINPILSCGSVMITRRRRCWASPTRCSAWWRSPWWWSPACWR